MRLRALALLVPLLVTGALRAEQAKVSYPPTAEVRAAFLKQLDRPRIPLDPKVEKLSPVEEGFTRERLSIASEKHADGRIERVPLLVVQSAGPAAKRPAVIVLHGTGGTKEGMRDWLERLARRGFVAVAIDARYHGERAGGAQGADAYNRAIVRAWRAKPGEPQEHPFYYDTVWDLWRTLDYLQTRPDVDGQRLGMLGISMGGIQTWLAASVDERVRVAVPAISVQSFKWSLEHERWQGRAATIQAAHDAAAADLGAPAVDAKVCRTLWDKLIPGILDQFDAPSMLRLFAGRPLLILNGDQDPNCPIEGARLAIASAEEAYRAAGASDRLRVMIAKDTPHRVTAEQTEAASDWLARWLLQ
jgi:dienelactone hydrolase